MIQWIIIIASLAACSTLWFIKYSKKDNPYLNLSAHMMILPLWGLVVYILLIITVPQVEKYVGSSSKVQRLSIYNDTDTTATFALLTRVKKPDISGNYATFVWQAVYPTANEVDYLDWQDLWQHASRFQLDHVAAPHSKDNYIFNIDYSVHDRMGVFSEKSNLTHALAFPSPELPVEIYLSDLLALQKNVKRSLSFEFRYFAAFLVMALCLVYYLLTAKGKWWLRIIIYLLYIVFFVISAFYAYLFGRILLNHYFNI